MDILKLVSRNLFQRKGRFALTLLGITIGMASFVALMTLGGNMQGAITKQANALGANLIIASKNWCIYDQVSILTGDSLPESLAYDALDKITAIDGITAIPHITQKTAVKNNPVLVMGLLPVETWDFKDWSMEDGTWFTSQDERAIVLGESIAHRYELSVGDTLNVRGETFPIIGILEETASNDDTVIYLPISVVHEIYDVDGMISYISAQVDDMAKMDDYIAAIHDVASVSVTSDEQLLESVLSMVGSVNVTLQLIAGVALLAAAFGIINTMMTAIYERKREIGIMRAIGGKRSAVFKIFLFESGLYGLLGGILGVAVGIIVSIVAAPLINEGEFSTMLSGATETVFPDISIIVATILFSLAISVISGLYPALKAAKLTPVEAINYG